FTPAVLIGAGLLIGVVLGGRAPVKERIRGFFAAGEETHRRRTDLVIVAIPLGVLAVHSLLHAMGKMASNGEVRYMMVAAPMWALLACRGWSWLMDRLGTRRAVLAAGLGAVLPLLIANTAHPVLPLKNNGDWHVARAVADWYINEA